MIRRRNVMEKLSGTKVQFICPSTLTYRIHNDRNYSNKSSLLSLLPWRNWLARSTVRSDEQLLYHAWKDDLIKTNTYWLRFCRMNRLYMKMHCTIFQDLGSWSSPKWTGLLFFYCFPIENNRIYREICIFRIF